MPAVSNLAFHLLKGLAPAVAVRRCQFAAQSVTLSTTYSRYSLTFAIPSASGKTVGTNGNDATVLQFCYSSGSTTMPPFYGNPGVQSGSVWLWGVQLEIGNVATPLEKPDPRYDLSNCQRFARLVYASARFSASGASQFVDNTVSFPDMRAVPTITPGAVGISANATVIGLTASSNNAARYEIQSVGAGDCYGMNYGYLLSADL